MSRTPPGQTPQKIDMDDGYFPLARTAVLTLAKTRLSGAQRSIVDVIFAQTYGYAGAAGPHREPVKKRRTRAPIAHEYFMTATWMGKAEVSRAINTLINWRIIVRDKNTVPYTYWFNVQVDGWSPDCWRVNRIANREQDSEPVNRIANSKQDCQPVVSRTANCWQALSLEPQGLPGFLNKDLNKINNNNDHHEQDISVLTTTFARALNRPLTDYELNQLANWSRQTPAELLTEALKKAVLLDKANFAYINGILRDWQKHGVVTLAGVKEHDEAFKNQKGSMIRGPTRTTVQTGNAGGYPAKVPEAGAKRPPGAYDCIDFSKFEFPG